MVGRVDLDTVVSVVSAACSDRSYPDRTATTATRKTCSTVEFPCGQRLPIVRFTPKVNSHTGVASTAWLLYARAVVLTSDCPPSLGFSGYSPSLTNRKAAIDDLDLAIDLDSTLADAWLLRALQKTFFIDASESEDSPAFDRENILADFDQAAKLAPDPADALYERGQFIESQLNENARC
jgi:hypothetical protein